MFYNHLPKCFAFFNNSALFLLTANSQTLFSLFTNLTHTTYICFYNTVEFYLFPMSDDEGDIYSDVDDSPLFIPTNKTEPKASSLNDQWLAKLPIETKDVVKAPKAIQSKSMGLHATATKQRTSRRSRRRTTSQDEANSNPAEESDSRPTKVARRNAPLADGSELQAQPLITPASSTGSLADETNAASTETTSPLYDFNLSEYDWHHSMAYHGFQQLCLKIWLIYCWNKCYWLVCKKRLVIHLEPSILLALYGHQNSVVSLLHELVAH
ncbi:hypothetical protein BDF19DRAFT_148633 [Syncephalis fuscata]|nr:hypothetical protein BDF19DRAFT_148633 [Syncephalis fuscata]